MKRIPNILIAAGLIVWFVSAFTSFLCLMWMGQLSEFYLKLSFTSMLSGCLALFLGLVIKSQYKTN